MGKISNIFHVFYRKYFTSTFEDSVVALYKATEEDDQSKLREFKRFVNEFGTHYAVISEIGTKLSIERRYTSEERDRSNVDEIGQCNTLVGTKVFGFQMEKNFHNCSNDDLKSQRRKSKLLERTVISTHGSFIGFNSQGVFFILPYFKNIILFFL